MKFPGCPSVLLLAANWAINIGNKTQIVGSGHILPGAVTYPSYSWHLVSHSLAMLVQLLLPINYVLGCKLILCNEHPLVLQITDAWPCLPGP